MNKKLSFLLLALICLSLSLYGYKPSRDYLSSLLRSVPKQLSFCPPTNLVVANQDNPQSFEIKGVHWAIDYHGWQAPEKIGFMQVLNQDNKLVCYYQWPNPKKKGTNLWMTVKLSPTVNTKIIPYGSYWSKNNQLCSAGIDACAYEIRQQ
ncbi:hypothetical protein [Legionella sp. km772]|uniref:hypothetical protein n=1 Tax=Legionella sp. km772 TaxID=2498111 RepID=UPI000F8DF857|nr:hypothetical protein [Legionella sp. km772]RUR04269.1 hypothetical protein ELY15_15720 [Legionella sp. km772]